MIRRQSVKDLVCATMRSMTKHTLLQQLKDIRESSGFCQQEMGERLQITRQGYGHLESGKRKMSLERAEQAFEVLGYTLDAHPVTVDCNHTRDNETSVNDKITLVQTLYRVVISRPFHLQTLKRILSELQNSDWDDLNDIVTVYLNNKSQRQTIVDVVHQFDRSYK